MKATLIRHEYGTEFLAKAERRFYQLDPPLLVPAINFKPEHEPRTFEYIWIVSVSGIMDSFTLVSGTDREGTPVNENTFGQWKGDLNPGDVLLKFDYLVDREALI